MSVLDLRHLQVDIGSVHAVRDVSLRLGKGECRALVGESGCGKSITAMSLLGLLPGAARADARRWQFAGEDVRQWSAKDWLSVRGNRIGMIFQNPMTALNPTQRIGDQIAESLCIHKNLSVKVARQRAIALLDRLAIPNPERRARQYPFEFSGGMLQRAMIAMATACEPELLIADEPTTALDVTVQSEVLNLLRELQQDTGMAMLFITHDLGVVATIADSVSVMYAGEIVESGRIRAVFEGQAHPYTEALKRAVPSMDVSAELQAIGGTPPDLRTPPSSCGFAERCAYRMAICEQSPPVLSCGHGHRSRCWRWHEDHPRHWREREL